MHNTDAPAPVNKRRGTSANVAASVADPADTAAKRPRTRAAAVDNADPDATPNAAEAKAKPEQVERRCWPAWRLQALTSVVSASPPRAVQELSSDDEPTKASNPEHPKMSNEDSQYECAWVSP